MDAKQLLRKIYWVSEWNYLGFLVHGTYGMDTKAEGNQITISATRNLRNPFNNSYSDGMAKEELDKYFIDQFDKLSKFFQFTYKMVNSSTGTMEGRFREKLQTYDVTVEIISINDLKVRDTKVSGNPLFFEGDDEEFAKWAINRYKEVPQYVCW